MTWQRKKKHTHVIFVYSELKHSMRQFIQTSMYDGLKKKIAPNEFSTVPNGKWGANFFSPAKSIPLY